MGRRWDVARSACREIREFVGELRDELRRPAPVYRPYIRCDRCGRVAPRLTEAHTTTFVVDARQAAGRRFTSTSTPPETVCPLCEHRQPRTVGDKLPAAAADARRAGVDGVEVAEFASGHRWGLLGRWRRCGEVFTAPVVAAAVICPVCGTVTPGPAADD